MYEVTAHCFCGYGMLSRHPLAVRQFLVFCGTAVLSCPSAPPSVAQLLSAVPQCCYSKWVAMALRVTFVVALYISLAGLCGLVFLVLGACTVDIGSAELLHRS